MRPHGIKHDDRFYSDPPPWARDLFSVRQLETLTFTKLWCKSVAASSLDRGAKLVALTLALYFSGNEHEVNDPSVARLADEASMHRSTVIAKLDVLENVGLIRRERSAGRVRTRYELTVPDVLPIRAQPSTEATVVPSDGSGSGEGPTVGLADSTVGFSAQPSDSDPPTVASSDPKGLKGLTEGNKKGGADEQHPEQPLNGEVEGQDQEPADEQTPEEKAYGWGVIVGRSFAQGKCDESKAREMLDGHYISSGECKREAWRGFQDGQSEKRGAA